MVSAFPHDYMHLVCLGVMRRLIYSWMGKSNSKIGKLSSRDIIELSSCLINAHQYWPSEFNRKPSGLLEIEFWKATELRQFLLYLGPVYLKLILKKEVYRHFLLLYCGISILSSSELHETLNDRAQEFLKMYQFTMDQRVKEGEPPEGDLKK